MRKIIIRLLFLSSLTSTTGGLGFLLVNLLNDTDGNSLFHISDGESTKRWVILEVFNAHWFGWQQFNHSSITSLDKFWVVLKGFTSSSVDLGDKGLEFTGSVGGVAIKDWGVSSSDLVGVVKNDNLSGEVSAFSGWVFLSLEQT